MKAQGPERKFKAAPGAGFDDAAAQRYGMFLERKVGLSRGPQSPQTIVDASRPKSAPTHGCFEWNDTEAATQYRLVQARNLVNHLLVVRETDGGSTLTRAFHSVVARPSEDEPTTRGYISEQIVWQTPRLADQIVREALRELQSWRNRYAEYSALQREVGLVDEALQVA